jgi:hypothetical protein
VSTTESVTTTEAPTVTSILESGVSMARDVAYGSYSSDASVLLTLRMDVFTPPRQEGERPCAHPGGELDLAGTRGTGPRPIKRPRPSAPSTSPSSQRISLRRASWWRPSI